MQSSSRFKKLRELALALPEVTEQPHFEKTSFRVKKKIFCTYDSINGLACFHFSLIDQSVFTLIEGVKPVPNKWGKLGWTHVDIANVKMEVLKDALNTAYCEVAPKDLAQQIKHA